MSGAVPRFGEVMDNIFDSNFFKATFIESKADSICEGKFTESLKVNEDSVKFDTGDKNDINTGAAV